MPLVNAIHHAFSCDLTCKRIWVNLRELALFSTPDEALMRIFNKIIDELLESGGDINRKATIKRRGKYI